MAVFAAAALAPSEVPTAIQSSVVLLLGLFVDPIVFRFQRVTVGKEGTPDCTRIPLLQDLPVLLPLVLHHLVDPIQPGRPVVGFQRGRSVVGLSVMGLPSGKVHQKVPKKAPLFLPWLFVAPVMFFSPITPPPLPGTPPVSL